MKPKSHGWAQTAEGLLGMAIGGTVILVFCGSVVAVTIYDVYFYLWRGMGGDLPSFAVILGGAVLGFSLFLLERRTRRRREYKRTAAAIQHQADLLTQDSNGSPPVGL